MFYLDYIIDIQFFIIHQKLQIKYTDREELYFSLTQTKNSLFKVIITLECSTRF